MCFSTEGQGGAIDRFSAFCESEKGNELRNKAKQMFPRTTDDEGFLHFADIEVNSTRYFHKIQWSQFKAAIELVCQGRMPTGDFTRPNGYMAVPAGTPSQTALTWALLAVAMAIAKEEEEAKQASKPHTLLIDLY